ncbi:hypothetical protein E2C01_098058 [Portunus trituberculatus]|uniref:Uncharacterized protein n=1 Tax=Portunus trituberculatus TaxID=210409 RepID=A0A5B7K202_PORTR|nr:hypothetical protein [Portunus trituberculatus]
MVLPSITRGDPMDTGHTHTQEAGDTEGGGAAKAGRRGGCSFANTQSQFLPSQVHSLQLSQ